MPGDGAGSRRSRASRAFPDLGRLRQPERRVRPCPIGTRRSTQPRGAPGRPGSTRSRRRGMKSSRPIWSAAPSRRPVLSLDEGHGEVRQAGGVAGHKQGDDVWMLKPPHEGDLTLEPIGRQRSSHFAWQQLHDDSSSERGVRARRFDSRRCARAVRPCDRQPRVPRPPTESHRLQSHPHTGA